MANEAPTTPGRYTRVRFDTNDQGIIVSPWGLGMPFDKLTRQTDSNALNCTLISNQGWSLTPHQLDISKIHELTITQDSIIKAQADGGTLQVAPNVTKRYAWRAPTELTGVLTGASSGIASQGDYFLSRKIAANNDWASSGSNLLADQTAFPGLDRQWTESPENFVLPTVPLVRVAADTINQQGTQPFIFRFVTTGSKADTPEILYVLYFVGPPSSELAWNGTGQYGMVIKGDGSFSLYERKSSRTTSASNPYVWRDVYQGRYAPKGQVADTSHRIIIYPYVAKNKAPWGGSITFYSTTAGVPSPYSTLIDLFFGGADNQEMKYVATLDSRNPNTPKLAVKPMPIRVSQRADLRSEFQLSYLSYETQGFIVSDPFVVPLTLTASSGIRVYYFADLPPSTSITLQLFDVTGAASGVLTTENPRKLSDSGLPITGSGAFVGGGYTTFSPISDPSQLPGNVFVIRARLFGNVRSSPGAVEQATPILKRLTIAVDGAITSSASEFSIEYPASITEVNVTGPEGDPSHETATVSIADLGSQYSILNVRGEFPCKIDTRYSGVDWSNPANEGRQSVIFDGYAVQSPAHRMGTDLPAALGSSTLGSFPASDWKSYRGALVGKWKRLHESVSTFNWDFTIDSGAAEIDTPPYVVDVINSILTWAGFSADMIDIGPGTSSSSSFFPIRLFPRGQTNEGIAITAGANWAEFVQGLARDYLGAALVWDANATANDDWGSDYTLVNGCWRLIHPAIAPFNTLCNFTTRAPVGAGNRVIHTITAYPSANGTGSYTSQVIQTVPIFKDTLDTSVSPPEVNKVVVSGTGQLNNGKEPVVDQLTDFLVNITSYNYNGYASSDPTSPDYVGRERVGYKVDTVAINNAESLAWVLRRYYALTAHAIKHISFTAPLVLVTDSTDTKQKRPRPLRFYDPITIDGQTFIIRNCNPYWVKDSHQLARYEAQSVPPEYCVPGLMV